jgi:microcystin-dependent protein
MSDPFIGEIKMVAFTFAAQGWANCDGQLLSIASNTALFSLVGTTYGGDGRTTFALPDLRGRVPIHVGQGPGLSNRVQGSTAGQESVTLSTLQIPSHSHPLAVNVPVTDAIGNQTQPNANRLARANDGESNFSDAAANGSLAATGTVGNAGGSLAHDNMPPFLTIRFTIALFGVFPSRS